MLCALAGLRVAASGQTADRRAYAEAAAGATVGADRHAVEFMCACCFATMNASVPYGTPFHVAPATCAAIAPTSTANTDACAIA